MSLLASGLTVQEIYYSGLEKVRKKFESSQDGHSAIAERSKLVDAVILHLWSSQCPAGSEGLCIVAIGGYGRGALFPCSDVDLLFLLEQSRDQDRYKQLIEKICQTLWDMQVRVSAVTRTLAECGQLQANNLEFSISLLNCRYLCGYPEMFDQLRTRIIPSMARREASEMMQKLCDLTRSRHKKYGHTIFHLEPNIKDCPGGIRDYQVACWLAIISELEKSSAWPATHDLFPSALREDCNAALQFLTSIRCFLHLQQGRDLNTLTYELQSEAAARGIGVFGRSVSPPEWMRAYFRHVRSIYRLTVFLDEVPVARSGLYRVFRNHRSRLSNLDFSVAGDRVFLRQRSSIADPTFLFSLFEFVARHGVKLSADTERSIESAVPELQRKLSAVTNLWEHLRPILMLPHAGAALRAMHRLGVLVVLFEEFRLIDSLVIRDYYHRYTVDEHSFVAIETVHALNSQDESKQRFRDILIGIERPDLLFLSLLFHDLGKGMPADNHVEGSLAALKNICDRLQLKAYDRELVFFLVAQHLRMSETIQKRNILDPDTIHDFAKSVGSTERLKMLTVFTYADVSAVHPQALTPWKTEMLWRLFAASENYLNRSVDESRLQTDRVERELEHILGSSSGREREDVARFLDGFPRRYLLTNTRAELLAHYEMWRKLEEHGVQVCVTRRGEYWQLAVVTADRQGLFATLAGVLSAWRLDILKAEAFSNTAGVVLDTIRFSDRFHTLEMNPSETQRLERQVADAIHGYLDVESLVAEHARAGPHRSKLRIKPRIHFDNHCSSHSTLLELVASDRPGLLYDISTVLTELGCNIEVALVDTQGQTALDIFYLTFKGAKLSPESVGELRAAIFEQLGP